MQGSPINAGENRSLPVDMLILPEQLKKLNYKTHLVGKWHLGSARRAHTPIKRGFDTHFGYWNGYTGYFSYESSISTTVKVCRTNYMTITSETTKII